jgi:hypothetical protein
VASKSSSSLLCQGHVAFATPTVTKYDVLRLSIEIRTSDKPDDRLARSGPVSRSLLGRVLCDSVSIKRPLHLSMLPRQFCSHSFI